MQHAGGRPKCETEPSSRDMPPPLPPRVATSSLPPPVATSSAAHAIHPLQFSGAGSSNGSSSKRGAAAFGEALNEALQEAGSRPSGP